MSIHLQSTVLAALGKKEVTGHPPTLKVLNAVYSQLNHRDLEMRTSIAHSKGREGAVVTEEHGNEDRGQQE